MIANCQPPFLTALGSPPINAGAYVPVFVNASAREVSVITRFAEGRITWAEKAREMQQIEQQFQAEKGAVDAQIAEQQRIAAGEHDRRGGHVERDASISQYDVLRRLWLRELQRVLTSPDPGWAHDNTQNDGVTKAAEVARNPFRISLNVMG